MTNFLKTPLRREPLCQCGEPLGPRVDGIRHTINGKEVCEDCYFDSLGKLVDEHSIGRIITRPQPGGIFYTIDGKVVSEDFYFDQLGELVEKRPIGVGRVR